MLSRSISATDAAPTPTATARRRMIGASRSRWAADSVFESRTPGIRWQSGRMIDRRRDHRPAGRGDADLVDADDAGQALRQRARSKRRVGTIAAIGPG